MLLGVFGRPADWPDQDLIGFSDEFDSELALLSYQCGVFPMPLNEGAEMGWWSPLRRGVLELGDLVVSHSLRTSARKYRTTIDLAFDKVLARCADPNRPGGWIDTSVRVAYTELHAAGKVHSIETWDRTGRLVGGLYGVSMGALFAGESMFHDPRFGRDASKVALLRLISVLRARPDHQALLDVQWLTPHLASLGASEIARDDYLAALSFALDQSDTEWPRDAQTTWQTGSATLAALG